MSTVANVGEIEAVLRLRNEMSEELRRGLTDLDEMSDRIDEVSSQVEDFGKTKSINQVAGQFNKLAESTDKARSSTREFSPEVKALFDSLHKTDGATQAVTKNSALMAVAARAAAGAGSAAGAAFVAGTVAAYKLSQELKRTSAITDLSTGFLQELKFAGDQVGSSLKQTTSAVASLHERVGRGTPAIVGALKQIGLTLEEARASDPEALFKAVVRGLDTVESAFDRAAIRQALFGRSGRELAPLLDDYERLADGAWTMSQRTIDAFDAISGAISRWKDNAIAAIGEVAGAMLSADAWRTALSNPGGLGLAFAARQDTGPAPVDEAARNRRIAEAFGATGAKPVPDDPFAQIDRLRAELDEAAAEAKRVDRLVDELTGRTLRRDVELLEQAVRRIHASTDGAEITAFQYRELGKELSKMRQEGATLPPILDDIRFEFDKQQFAAKVLNDSFGDVIGTLRTAKVAFGELQTPVAMLTSELNTKIKPLEFLARSLPGPKLKELKAPPLPFGRQVAGEFGDVLGKTIADIATEEGDHVTAIGAQMGQFLGGHLSKQAGAAITRTLGSTIGGALTAVLPGIGALLGPLAGKFGDWIVGLFTGGEGAKANDLRDELKSGLMETVEGLTNDPDVRAALERFNTAGTRQDVQSAFDDAMKAAEELTATMDKYGLSLDDVGDQTKRFARETKALSRDFDRLRSIGFSVEQITTGMADDLNALIATALETGQQIPAHLQPMLETLIRSGQISEEVARQMLGVADPVPWQEMEAAAERYGIQVDQLGKKFEQAKLDDAAKQLAEDWALLVDNGANVGAVIAGMSDEVRELIRRAIELGLTVPESLKPVAETMLEAGLLVDENGEKLTDLGKIEWSKPIVSEVDKLILKLDELITVLTDGVGGAIEGLPAIDIPVNTPELPGVGAGTPYGYPGTEVDTAHTGGMVTPTGIRKHHRGTARVLPFPSSLRTDEVPAILQAGESVLNRRATSAMGAGQIQALNQGRAISGDSVVINVYPTPGLSERQVAEMVYRRLPGRIKQGGR